MKVVITVLLIIFCLGVSFGQSTPKPGAEIDISYSDMKYKPAASALKDSLVKKGWRINKWYRNDGSIGRQKFSNEEKQSLKIEQYELEVDIVHKEDSVVAQGICSLMYKLTGVKAYIVNMESFFMEHPGIVPPYRYEINFGYSGR